MPELNWIGKAAVKDHLKEVPTHLLVPDEELSCCAKSPAKPKSGSLGELFEQTEEGKAAPPDPADAGASGNLIVEGDNLTALQALLPRYAGQVKCIYIDPPYNTGNEGWVYNDNVNAPEIKRWLGRTVGKEAEDLSRHDKWLCMMYPRLQILKKFLREDGAIFISIDDNEVASLRLLMDEIFGRGNFVVNVVWRSADSSNNDAKQFSLDHNHTLVYSRHEEWYPRELPRTEEQNAHYTNPDNDPKGPWFSGNLSSPNPRENLRYKLKTPSGKIINPPSNGWRWSKDRMQMMIDEGEVIFIRNETAILRKTYLYKQKGLAPSSLWSDLDQTGHNRNAKYELKKLLATSIKVRF